MLYRQKIEKPLISSLNVGKVFGHTSLIHENCYVAGNIAKENLIWGDLKTLVSVRYFDYRLHGSSEHLPVKSSTAIHAESIGCSSMKARDLLAVVLTGLSDYRRKGW